MAYWRKFRDDADHIGFVFISDKRITVTAHRTNPAPKNKWQGWEVLGTDDKGTFFHIKGLDFKKDARIQIEIAKNKYIFANAERF